LVVPNPSLKEPQNSRGDTRWQASPEQRGIIVTASG
jgi:hypothetical protein